MTPARCGGPGRRHSSLDMMILRMGTSSTYLKANGGCGLVAQAAFVMRRAAVPSAKLDEQCANPSWKLRVVVVSIESKCAHGCVNIKYKLDV